MFDHVKLVKSNIKVDLKEKEALIFDGWTRTSMHYVGHTSCTTILSTRRNSESTFKLVQGLNLLAVSPPIQGLTSDNTMDNSTTEETKFNAEALLVFFFDVFEFFLDSPFQIDASVYTSQLQY